MSLPAKDKKNLWQAGAKLKYGEANLFLKTLRLTTNPTFCELMTRLQKV